MDRAFFWCGLVFALVGGLFAGIGLAFLPLYLAREPVFLLFPVQGAVFLVLGIGLLVWRRLRQRRSAALLETGQLIWADLVEVRPDTRFSVNGRHPYVLCCQAVEPLGQELCLFASEGIWDDPTPFLRPGMKVPVYVDPDDWGRYTVDTAAVLPGLGP